MISLNVPEIDFKNKQFLIIIFIVVVSFFLFNALEVKSLISIILLIIIIINYSNVKSLLSNKSAYRNEYYS